MPHRPPPPQNPREVRFVARLDLPPFDPPRLGRADPVFGRRVEADRLCLWLACSRALCTFEQDDVERPLLD